MATEVQRKSLAQPPIVEEHENDSDMVEAANTPLPWLTLETLLYGLIFIGAIVLRLWRLSNYPLSNVEAAQSLVAFNFYHSETFTSAYYSPLLASLNAFSFLLFGDSDASARLATIFLGSGLVILPLTLRRQLGSVVCLITTALLAFSPTALYLSRSLNSEVGVAVGALMMVAGFFNWSEEGQQRWLLLLAGGLAVALVAGPMAYAVLIIFALTVLIRLSIFRSLWARGLYLSTYSPEHQPNAVSPAETTLEPLGATNEVYVILNPSTDVLMNDASVSTTNETDEPMSDPSPQPSSSGKGDLASPLLATEGRIEEDLSTRYENLRQAGIFFVAALVLLSTMALFNLSGFSMLAASLNTWLNGFTLQPEPGAGFNAVFLLTIYEPLLILTGLIGLILVIMRGTPAATALAAWFVGMLLLDIAMIGRPNSNLILVLTPLVFLAAIALTELWRSVRDEATWGNEGVLLTTGLAITAFAYIGLTGWLDRVCGDAELPCQYAWLQAVAALLLFVVIIAFFGVMSDMQAALRGAALVGVALGLLFTVSIGWRLNYGPLMHLAYQPISGITPSIELLALTDTLAEQSARRVGDPTMLDVTLSNVDSPALEWQLRNHTHVQSDGLIQSDPTSAIITTANTELALEQGYIGQDFALDTRWSPVGLTSKDLIRWLIYRQLNIVPPGDEAILWMRVD